jgi:hypothetical protein
MPYRELDFYMEFLMVKFILSKLRAIEIIKISKCEFCLCVLTKIWSKGAKISNQIF